jgi:hypothetical protein
VRLPWRRVVVRWLLVPLLLVAALLWPVANATALLLLSGQAGQPSPQARGTGHDGLWLGHAWVDGRRTQADVDALVERLRGTGIRDLFIHTGPFNDDGTLDPALRPTAGWLLDALHQRLTGVRVQAWLGAHPVAEELHLWEPNTRAHILASVTALLDEGFDGIHYDFEPVASGDPALLAMLRETHRVTAAHGSVLSVSAVHLEPFSLPFAGPSTVVTALPGRAALWSGGYLAEVAELVDQVALMSYDTGLPTEPLYAGYLSRSTRLALSVVPSGVALLVGIPAYPPAGALHPAAENTATALRGVRLALGDQRPARAFGVALYVDFTATDEDWAAYTRDWASPQ